MRVLVNVCVRVRANVCAGVGEYACGCGWMCEWVQLNVCTSAGAGECVRVRAGECACVGGVCESR